ncbi:hypothetical protein [Paenibacillus polymyxa]|uniref:Uncharacterized protein n=1 Tax=Paenibacillus polymyxa (strain SC2) TaxID=886882 RepID=E3EL50_PAEPS|nr:hypothetical protein [Paenibacillus polymyxa]ADO59612.1 hypothetical protein PPSC2_27085 [Paenibacillus polymyxa SC2]WPQ59565.1 hypothetical protein SKN87_28285 [Paenibacillus polymyxa]
MEELETDYIRNNTSINDETADRLTKEFKTIWRNIEAATDIAGWKLAFSHDMSEKCFGWWDVIFTQGNWNEETFMSIWKLFSDFNKRLDEVFEQYNM